MGCETLRFPDGTTAIVCGVKRKRVPCSICNRPGDKLCDGERGRTLGGKVITCDVPLCNQCAQHVEPDTDYCPKHRRPA